MALVLSSDYITPTELTGYVREALSDLPQNAFGGGTTVVTPRTQVGAVEERARMIVLPKATSVAEVARALNAST